ncbi:NAC transcription factor 32 [Linum perenne]
MKFADSSRVAGNHFTATDEELVFCYLLRKLLKRSLPSSDYVRDCDLYGDLEPWEIWSTFRVNDVGGVEKETEDMYFFTPRKKIVEKGKNFVRTVGKNGGNWHGEGRCDESKVGDFHWEIKRYKYMPENNKRKRIQGEAAATEEAGWILHEYGFKNEGLTDYVLCRLRRKKKVVNKKKSQRCFTFDCHEVGKIHGSDDIQQDVIMEEKKTTTTDATADEIEQVVVEEKKTTTNAADDDDSGFLDVIDFSIESLLENNEDEVEQDDIDFITQLESSLENNEDEVEQDDIDFITEIEKLLENNDDEVQQDDI